MSADNKPIGRFGLDGIPPAPRGVPQIEVTFDIDANGILHVSAKDLGTGKEQKITITASSGLSKEEIERMRRDAEVHASEDAQKREEVEARNMAENLVYQTEKVLKENGDKIAAEKRAPVEHAVQELKDALKSGVVETIKAKQEALNTAMQAVAQELYAKAGPQPGDASAGGGESGPAAADASEKRPDQEGVIDADFTMVDDDKKKK